MTYKSRNKSSREIEVQGWKSKAWLNSIFFFDIQIEQYAQNRN